MTNAEHGDHWVEEELVEAEAAAEAIAQAMVKSGSLSREMVDTATELEDTLRKTARSLRLAVVAEAESAMVSRLRLRLQMAIGQAWSLVDSRAHAPASQRPTLPPALGMSAEEVWSNMHADLTAPPPPRLEWPAHERKTVPVRADSGVVAKIGTSAKKLA